MRSLDHIFEKNRNWVQRTNERDPSFFQSLQGQQSPRYLWIGCSDSRVPANEICDLPPGELFVHRNVANVVVHSDLNCLSVLQYAIDVLKAEHVIVCGHYGCGGVRAAYSKSSLGLIDNWLRHVQDVHAQHERLVVQAGGVEAGVDRLCELNVLEQVRHVSRTTVVQDAWRRGQPLALHGWIYALRDGLLRDLHCTVTEDDDADVVCAEAIARLAAEPRRVGIGEPPMVAGHKH